MDWHKWKDKAMWQRDANKENDLIKRLKINDGEEYNLINNHFRTNNTGVTDIKINNGQRNIELAILPGFSLFDWAKVIENATEIHTVSTSIIYILELLQLKAKHVGIYPRKPDESNLQNIEYILTSHNYTHHL